jgi:hypothetical protein
LSQQKEKELYPRMWAVTPGKKENTLRKDPGEQRYHMGFPGTNFGNRLKSFYSLLVIIECNQLRSFIMKYIHPLHNIRIKEKIPVTFTLWNLNLNEFRR